MPAFASYDGLAERSSCKEYDKDTTLALFKRAFNVDYGQKTWIHFQKEDIFFYFSLLIFCCL